MLFRSSSTIRYHFDEANRLTLTKRDTAGRLFLRRTLEGRVSVDRKNRLVYRVQTPAGRQSPGPKRYVLDGTWGLTQQHALKLSLHAGARGRRQTLYLRGALERTKARTLSVSLRRHSGDGRPATQRLTLRGRWAANRANRLTFLVERARGAEDKLTLQGSWDVGEHHSLRYRFRRFDQASRQALQTLRWRGNWDIPRAGRLVFRVEGDSDSAFDFRASLQSKSLQAREGRIVYQAGIGWRKSGRRQTQVVLFGRWKLNRDLSVTFEVPYEGGRLGRIRFAATLALTQRNALALRLEDGQGVPLGLVVTFTRRFLKDAEWFVRLRRSPKESEALAGVQIPF